MNEQDKQDVEEISVQTSDKDREKPKSKRSAEERIGRLKYHEVLTKKVFVQNENLLALPASSQVSSFLILCDLFHFL